VVAAITGAAGGIGRAVAHAFARESYAVSLIDLDADGLAAAASDPAFENVDVASVVADLSDAASCERAIQETLQKLGRVDVVVNNAGIGAFAALPEMPVAEIDAVLDVDGRAPLLLSRAIIPHLVARGSGAIVSISSAAAKIGYANLAPYSAAKAALIGFTRALAVELAPNGVRVNAVCPGPTNTAMMANNVRERMETLGIDYEEALDHWVKDIPMKAMIEPEDIADAVVFLASDRARSITGEALNVSGGFVMW
jgi:meso-butanediol dehydrogenase/(S,S)-butanediol dehydrogenase/diacetyl reductase